MLPALMRLVFFFFCRKGAEYWSRRLKRPGHRATKDARMTLSLRGCFLGSSDSKNARKGYPFLFDLTAVTRVRTFRSASRRQEEEDERSTNAGGRPA